MLTLASSSAARRRLLEAAGVAVTVRPARVDEAAVVASLLAEGASPRDVADCLAEMKATRRAGPGLVLGSDQVLAHEGRILSKPATPADAVAQLRALSGGTHDLLTAAVIAEDGRPVWRHVARARLTMRALGEDYVADYVERCWDDIRHCVGSYMLEAEGARFFTRVEGDHFAVQGLPLLEVLGYLVTRGVIRA